MIEEATLTAIRGRLSAALAPPVGHDVALFVDGRVIGRMSRARAARLADFDAVFARHDGGLTLAPQLAGEPARSAALAQVARSLAAEGLLTRWRDELYAVKSSPEAPPLFCIERAAARFFGVVTHAAHVNGLVRDGDDVRMWVARRSDSKAIDPGQLDNLVAGGVRAGASIAATVVREAWEEAGIVEALAQRARAAGAVRVCRGQPDGLQREVIYVHDLWLPADYRPRCTDGEAVAHRLVSLEEAASLIANAQGAEVVTADASLVILDALFRHGAIAPDSASFLPLACLRWPRLGSADD